MYVNEINDCKMWSVNCIYYDLKSSSFVTIDSLSFSGSFSDKVPLLTEGLP